MNTTKWSRRRRRLGALSTCYRDVRRATDGRRGAALAIAACLGALALVAVGHVALGGLAGNRQSRLFFRPLDGDLLGSYGGVVAVAHNAGDNLAATRRALDYGARIVEVDVVSMGGRLYAGHDAPLPVVGPVTFRQPTLEEVWTAAAGADAIMLDLKESSPAFLELVFAFLAERPATPRVMLVDGNLSTLRAFRERAPEVVRILGVSPPGRLATLQADEALLELLDGVVMRHSLIDEPAAAWLTARGLFTIVYTVNDLIQVNRLIGLGVVAIVTDNLAIMELLGRDRRDAASA